jgi:hypothetical protein
MRGYYAVLGERSSARPRPFLLGDTMSDFEKPKRDAVTERLLNQFNSLDGPKGCNDEYRSGWDRIFGKKVSRKPYDEGGNPPPCQLGALGIGECDCPGDCGGACSIDCDCNWKPTDAGIECPGDCGGACNDGPPWGIK